MSSLISLIPGMSDYTLANSFGANTIFPLRTSLVASKGVHSLTHTRATTATFTDHEGLIRTAKSGEMRFNRVRRVENLLRRSEDLTNASWTKQAGTTASAVDTIATFTGGVGERFSQSVLTGVSTTGRTFRGRCEIKGESGKTVIIGLKRVSGGSAGEVTVTITLNGDWQLVATAQYTGLASNTGVSMTFQNTGNSPDTLYLRKLQLEENSGQAITAPSEYQSTDVLSAPYQGLGVDGVKNYETANGNTVSGSNIITEATGAALTDADADPIIPLIEQKAATNICLQSETMGTTWVASNVTVTSDSFAAPSGATRADTLTASAGNGTLIQDLGVLSSAERTFSIWLRRKTGTGNIQMTLDNGSTWTTKTITSSWARYSITQTLANPDCGIRIVTSGDEVYAWGAQVEAGAFPTSHIPTTTITVTRNADILTLPLAAYSDTQGSVYAEVWAPLQASSDSQQLVGKWFVLEAATLTDDDGTVVNSVALDVTSVKKVCTTWNSVSQRIAAEGATADEDNYDGSWGHSGSVPIGGSSSDVVTVPCGVRNLILWYARKLSSAQQDAMIA